MGEVNEDNAESRGFRRTFVVGENHTDSESSELIIEAFTIRLGSWEGRGI